MSCMSYQSKTYSLSGEVVAAIEAAKATGESPNQYLWRLIFGGRKASERDVAQLVASVVTVPVSADEADSRDDTAQGRQATLDTYSPELSSSRGKATTETHRAPLLKPGEKTRK